MPPETDNLRLEELAAADQAERDKGGLPADELRRRDAERRREVLEMIGQGHVNTPNDLYRAALILQHGAGPKDFLTAHRLSTLAALQGHRPARWLVAASLDRFLMSTGSAQVYGTQFERNDEEKRHQLRLPIDDSSVLHFEKRLLGVPSVAERLAQLNAKIKTA